MTKEVTSPTLSAIWDEPSGRFPFRNCRRENSWISKKKDRMGDGSNNNAGNKNDNEGWMNNNAKRKSDKTLGESFYRAAEVR